MNEDNVSSQCNELKKAIRDVEIWLAEQYAKLGLREFKALLDDDSEIEIALRSKDLETLKLHLRRLERIVRKLTTRVTKHT